MHLEFYKENDCWNLNIKENNSDHVIAVYHFREDIKQEDIITVVTTLAKADGLQTSINFTNYKNKSNE